MALDPYASHPDWQHIEAGEALTKRDDEGYLVIEFSHPQNKNWPYREFYATKNSDLFVEAMGQPYVSMY